MKLICRYLWNTSTKCGSIYQFCPKVVRRHNHFNLRSSRFSGDWKANKQPLYFTGVRCMSARKAATSMAVADSETDPRPVHSSGSGPRSRIVWVDMEMTGLDPDQHKIVEVSCVVTDADLNILAEAPTLVIYQPSSVLDNMSQWCRDNFSKSGLIEQVKSSLIDLPTADQQLVEFVKAYCDKKCAPLAGNSVWADRMFMAKQLPLLNDYLHYRIVDVSSVKELCKRWFPREFSHAPKKDLKHRALSDIRESIDELKYYRKNIFKEIPGSKANKQRE